MNLLESVQAVVKANAAMQKAEANEERRDLFVKAIDKLDDAVIELNRRNTKNLIEAVQAVVKANTAFQKAEANEERYDLLVDATDKLDIAIIKLCKTVGVSKFTLERKDA